MRNEAWYTDPPPFTRAKHSSAMSFKKVDPQHFQTFIAARDGRPEPKATGVKSYGYRVQRLYYRSGEERIAFVQMNRDGQTSYHISLAA